MITLRKNLYDFYIFGRKTPKNRLWPKIVILGSIGSILGYMNGVNDSDTEDKTKYCIKFEGNEE